MLKARLCGGLDIVVLCQILGRAGGIGIRIEKVIACEDSKEVNVGSNIIKIIIALHSCFMQSSDASLGLTGTVADGKSRDTNQHEQRDECDREKAGHSGLHQRYTRGASGCSTPGSFCRQPFARTPACYDCLGFLLAPDIPSANLASFTVNP